MNGNWMRLTNMLLTAGALFTVASAPVSAQNVNVAGA